MKRYEINFINSPTTFGEKQMNKYIKVVEKKLRLIVNFLNKTPIP